MVNTIIQFFFHLVALHTIKIYPKDYPKLSAYGSVCVSADESIDKGGGWRGGRVFLYTYSYWYDEWKRCIGSRHMKGKNKDDWMSWIPLRSSLITPWGCIQRETSGIGPYAGAEYDLIFSHCRLRNPAFYQKTKNVDKCFPNFSKMTATSRKRESTRKGVGADFMA